MSPVSNFGLLALAGLAAAVPHAHNHRMAHQHLHARDTTTTTANSQSHFSMPSCWSSCFQKYDVTDEACLCDTTTGSSVKSCIDTSCMNTPGAVKQYSAWLSNYCSPSGSGTGTAVSMTMPTQTYPMSSPTEYPTTWTTTSEGSSWVVTSTSTDYVSPVSTGAMTSAVGGWGETCGADVTITTKVYATVTVTAGGWGGESQQSAWNWQSTETGAWTSETTETGVWTSEYTSTATGGWGGEGQSTTTTVISSPQESPVEYTSEASSPSPYVPASPTPTSTSTPVAYVSVGNSSPETSAATSAPHSVPTGSSSSGGSFAKRGLAYNVAADTEAFSGMGWAYNWGSLPQGLESSSITYIPMLWSSGEPFVGYWNENAETVLASGAEYFFSFNEPDMPSQANMSPQEAADAWMQYMEPYAGRVKLVAPAVTNGQGSGLGLDWLSQFMTACSSCTIDAVNQHWYDSTGNDVDLFKSQIGQIASQFGKPVFVSEFAGIGSDDEIISFMQEVTGWMDSESSVIGYSYYMVGDGFLNSGTGLSPLGEAYNA